MAVSAEFSETFGPLAGIMVLLLWAFVTGVALLAGLSVPAQLEGARAGVLDPMHVDHDGDGVLDRHQHEPVEHDATDPRRRGG